MSALSSKLTRAGIPITCPEDGIPLCDILPIKSLFATVALRPNSFGDVENRLRAIHQTLGGMTGAATSLLCATPISRDQNADQLLLASSDNNLREMLAMMRSRRQESARSLFRSAIANSDDYECFEAAFGLCAIGITEDDKPHLLSALKSQTDDDRKYAIITAMFQGGLLASLVEDGELDGFMEHIAVLEPLTELLDSDDPSSLIDACQSGLSWQKRVCVHYMLGVLAERLASPEYLEALLEVFSDESDSDAGLMSMYAIGQVVKHLGLSATQRVLEYAIEDFSSGSQKQCILINASYRAELNSEEAIEVIQQISAFDESDSDTQRALGRALDVFKDNQCDAINWLFTGGYGRGVDLYDPFYSEHGMIPKPLWAVFNSPNRAGLRCWLKAISQITISQEFSTLSTSVMLHRFPEISSLLSDFVSGSDGSDQTKSGIVASLLFSQQPCALSPIQLRCLLDQEHTGGPVLETPEVIGELLYYSQKQRTQLVARELMSSLSAESRQICASFLQAELRSEGEDRDLEKLLFRLGAQTQPPPKNKISADIRLAIGEKITSYELLTLIQEASESEREDYAQLILSLISGNDRQKELKLAGDKDLWNAIPNELIQSQFLSLSRGGWVKREVGSVLVGSAGARILEGPLGTSVSETLQRLCNDGDSDVKREARRAASMINLKVIILNAESICEGVLSDEPEEWVQRLYTFIKAEDDRSEILQLCRSAELWAALDQEELAAFWLEISRGGWVMREAAAVIAINHANLLMTSAAEQIGNRLVELSNDNDSDVEREAKTACVTLGL